MKDPTKPEPSSFELSFDANTGSVTYNTEYTLNDGTTIKDVFGDPLIGVDPATGSTAGVVHDPNILVSGGYYPFVGSGPIMDPMYEPPVTKDDLNELSKAIIMLMDEVRELKKEVQGRKE